MRNFFFLLLLTISFTSCKTITDDTTPKLEALIAELKQTYAPDGRTAVFDINIEQTADGYTLLGETDNPEALNQLKQELADIEKRIDLDVTTLPNSALGDLKQGVINNSVANLRSNPKHSAELSTQALLGTPVKVLKQKGEWYYIQTPDQYLAWVDHGAITLMNESDFNKWNTGKHILYLNTYGFSKAETHANAEVVSDLVSGNLLQLEAEKPNYYEVSYPDGRIAYVNKNEAINFDIWKQNAEATKVALTKTSKTLLGVPYLWGGTSTKGVDCSGFTKTVFLLNGIVLPRDASQQIHVGDLVDDTGDFSKLEVGDLLFFGTPKTDDKKERVVHVGMWIGNGEFIHASGQVRISSVNTDSPNYDEFNVNRYLRSKRITPQTDAGIIHLKSESLTSDLNI